MNFRVNTVSELMRFQFAEFPKFREICEAQITEEIRIFNQILSQYDQGFYKLQIR